MSHIMGLCSCLILSHVHTVVENGETTATVAEFGDCRTFLRQSQFSATDCRTFLRQCGQAITFSCLFYTVNFKQANVLKLM